ncbi:hypothetical protein Hypma_009714 [Hypsizygus marmoreus]|uniref:Uncharacterized protein n=1 Tax=Hypsizygus marmoreus TaxID=39966 RepID=A0A369JRK6_HYPMA|nr:hypothetical protein Hypma_009714 [Hypsizygus marmoreus]
MALFSIQRGRWTTPRKLLIIRIPIQILWTLQSAPSISLISTRAEKNDLPPVAAPGGDDRSLKKTVSAWYAAEALSKLIGDTQFITYPDIPARQDDSVPGSLNTIQDSVRHLQSAPRDDQQQKVSRAGCCYSQNLPEVAPLPRLNQGGMTVFTTTQNKSTPMASVQEPTHGASQARRYQIFENALLVIRDQFKAADSLEDKIMRFVIRAATGGLKKSRERCCRRLGCIFRFDDSQYNRERLLGYTREHTLSMGVLGDSRRPSSQEDPPAYFIRSDIFLLSSIKPLFRPMSPPIDFAATASFLGEIPSAALPIPRADHLDRRASIVQYSEGRRWCIFDEFQAQHRAAFENCMQRRRQIFDCNEMRRELDFEAKQRERKATYEAKEDSRESDFQEMQKKRENKFW